MEARDRGLEQALGKLFAGVERDRDALRADLAAAIERLAAVEGRLAAAEARLAQAEAAP